MIMPFGRWNSRAARPSDAGMPALSVPSSAADIRDAAGQLIEAGRTELEGAFMTQLSAEALCCQQVRQALLIARERQRRREMFPLTSLGVDVATPSQNPPHHGEPRQA